MEGKSLADQIRALNKKYGRILTLSELVECKKRGEITVSKELPIDEYAYVHATNFKPNGFYTHCSRRISYIWEAEHWYYKDVTW